MAAVLFFCLAGGMMDTGQADIVIRDVTDPSPVVWAWGSGDIQYIDSVCIGTDQPGFFSRIYRLTATGSGSGGSYYLQGPLPATTDVLSYTVQWNNSANQTTGNNLPAGVQRVKFMNPKLDLACAPSGVNATVIVTISGADLLNAPAGDYSGILYLLVEPL